MDKSQFNIKISKDLLLRLKRQAMMSGKSLTEHITDLVKKSLNDNEINTGNNNIYSFNKINHLEERLVSIESIVSNLEYLSTNLKPFTNSEAINCTKFMRGLFDQEIKKRNFSKKKDAFDDFYKHVKKYDSLGQDFIDRLKEVMLSEEPRPWTGKELNELTSNSKCNCSIRKGLINWIGIIDCPSQQEICDKGEELLPLC